MEIADVLLGYNGQRRDPVSGTYHLGNGYRAYNPVLMRFNCPDSWSPFGIGGINPYAYCAGDPINQADSSGHMSTGQWIGLGLGLVAGIVLSIATEGAALPAVLSLAATVTGDAAIGAAAEGVAEAVDGQRMDWASVGWAAGLGGAGSLIGWGGGKMAIRATAGLRTRLGNLMHTGLSGRGAVGGLVNPLASGQFRLPHLLGRYVSDNNEERLAYTFIDGTAPRIDGTSAGGLPRLNIVAGTVRRDNTLHAVISSGAGGEMSVDAFVRRVHQDRLGPTAGYFAEYRLLMDQAGMPHGTTAAFASRFRENLRASAENPIRVIACRGNGAFDDCLLHWWCNGHVQRNYPGVGITDQHIATILNEAAAEFADWQASFYGSTSNDWARFPGARPTDFNGTI
ncbi:RHS repeat-associated core domain protein containing protein [Herbaspirillum sp. CF444]|uniref:RHS repeat-associated core domain-containing protein n=1 Tax=Herbaspirillum sp. CF444 TaxID=1144319 RepID=UPI0002726E6C|nr:RHS repeat-associated core domain-containing protein [Herbaspirillum sp. CF444]EJL88518.1 RHS repeat-associated core domain protein containing protein [Herbaspirillum sp. CF444]